MAKMPIPTSSIRLMFFDYGGIKVYFEIQGEGRDLLLLHGWGCDHSEFYGFLPQMLQSHRVISLDFPGFGLSEEPLNTWGVEEYCRMTEALCEHLKVVEPQIICHSFGGRVAALFASRNAVGRMIWADAAGLKPRRSLKYYIKVHSYKLAKFFLLKVLRNEKAFNAMREKRGSSDYKSASERMKAVLSRTVNEDLSACLPKIKSPVLLFWGENDTATPLWMAKKMEKLLPDAAIILVKSGSHFSFIDDPALFSSMILTFLK